MAASIRRNTSPNSTPEKEAPNVAVIRNYTEAERRFMERQRKMVWSFLYFLLLSQCLYWTSTLLLPVKPLFISSFHYTQEVFFIELYTFRKLTESWRRQARLIKKKLRTSTDTWTPSQNTLTSPRSPGPSEAFSVMFCAKLCVVV